MCEFTHPTSLRDHPLNPNLMTGINGVSSISNQYKMFLSNNSYNESKEETREENKEKYNYRYPDINLNTTNFKGINGIEAYNYYKNNKKKNETFEGEKKTKDVSKLMDYYNNLSSLMIISLSVFYNKLWKISNLKRNMYDLFNNNSFSDKEFNEIKNEALEAAKEIYNEILGKLAKMVKKFGNIDKVIEYYYNNKEYNPYYDYMVMTKYIILSNSFIKKLFTNIMGSIENENFLCGCPFQYMD